MSQRPVKVRYPMIPTLFTPVQFHPRELLNVCKSCMWTWFTERLGVSFPQLVRDHHQSLVAVELDVEYLRPVDFFESNHFEVSVDKVQVRQGNSVLEMFHELRTDCGTFAKVRMLWRLLELDGDQALSGRPGQLRESILQRLLPGEIDPSRELRLVETRLALIEREGEKVGAAQQRFVLHRHQCEVADQWRFIELPALASEGRENLINALQADPMGLRSTFGKPLAEVLVKLSCPFYLFEDGEVQSEVFMLHGGPVFVHRVINLTRANTLAAIVIETF